MKYLLILNILLLSLNCVSNKPTVEQAKSADSAAVMAKLNSIFEFTSGTKTKLDNSRNHGDRWSERLAIIMVGVMALSYPIGKLIWLVFGSCKDTIKYRKIKI